MFLPRWILCFVLVVLVGGSGWCVPQSANVRDFGAKGDGLTDDTQAIQKALAAISSGGVVTLPAGAYIVSAALNVPHGGTLIGEGVRWENGTSQLYVLENGFSPIVLDHGASVKGLIIIYPNNMDNSNPTPYPPSILLNGINPSVENIVFSGAWIGVSTPQGGGNAGQGLFKELTGFVHHVGIHLDESRDVNRIQDVHWFVGGKDTPGKPSYYRHNRVGFEFGSVDGIIMERCFIIGGKTFFHQLPEKTLADGTKRGTHSLGHHIDQCWIEDVDYGFIFEGATGFVLSSANILIRKNGIGVKVTPQSLFYNGVIDSVQVRSFGEPIVGFEYGCLTPHSRNRLSIADCQVVDGSPALHLMSGAVRANIHDSHFQAVPVCPAIKIDRGADLFTIANNILSAPRAIQDNSGRRARKTIKGNLHER